MVASEHRRWRGEGLGAAQHRQRFLVERIRPRWAHHAAFQHATLPVEAEENLRHPLFAAESSGLGIALVALKCCYYLPLSKSAQQSNLLELPRQKGLRFERNRPRLPWRSSPRKL